MYCWAGPSVRSSGCVRGALEDGEQELTFCVENVGGLDRSGDCGLSWLVMDFLSVNR